MNDWPPNWQAMRVESLIARELRLSGFLVDMDEIVDLVSDDPKLAGEVRGLSARLRTRRNDWRDQVRAFQQTLEEVEQ